MHFIGHVVLLVVMKLAILRAPHNPVLHRIFAVACLKKRSPDRFPFPVSSIQRYFYPGF